MGHDVNGVMGAAMGMRQERNGVVGMGRTRQEKESQAGVAGNWEPRSRARAWASGREGRVSQASRSTPLATSLPTRGPCQACSSCLVM
jgi:hypothetical protein